MNHFSQIREAVRFQEYVENWSNPGNMEAPLYRIDQISKVPVSIYVGEIDFICTPQVAEEYSEQFGTLQNYYNIKGAGHLWFSEEAG